LDLKLLFDFYRYEFQLILPKSSPPNQTQTKKLETIYQHKINNLVELKKTILQKAFKGEL
jgi:hypothetical protein